MGPGGEPVEEASGRSPAFAIALALAALTVVLSLGGGLAAYVLGSRAGADLDAARVEGQRKGERVAAGELRPGQLRRAQRAGDRRGYRAAYHPARRAARDREIAAGPQACGDAQAAETPVIVKVRAQGVACPTALVFARDSMRCGGLDGACNGYACSVTSTGWEESEVTCRSGERTIRWITAV